MISRLWPEWPANKKPFLLGKGFTSFKTLGWLLPEYRFGSLRRRSIPHISILRENCNLEAGIVKEQVEGLRVIDDHRGA